MEVPWTRPAYSQRLLILVVTIDNESAEAGSLVLPGKILKLLVITFDQILTELFDDCYWICYYCYSTELS